VLREVEVLLEQGRAVGAKKLEVYLEVTGYAAAARWVHQQGREPSDWTTGDLVAVAEVRRIHTEAMSTVWDVAPHPHATGRTPAVFGSTTSTRSWMETDAPGGWS
jgi:hypothetical protein